MSIARELPEYCRMSIAKGQFARFLWDALLQQVVEKSYADEQSLLS